MTQQKQKKVSPAHQETPMSRKQALALICQLEETYVQTAIELDVTKHTNDFEVAKAFRLQVQNAIEVLTTAVHGPRPLGSWGLCRVCHLHYDAQTVWFFEDEQHSSLVYRRCCLPCSQRLEREHTLLTEQEVDKELGL